ncbi:MarR family winged helix-turn-helix transcriptional regulator [Allosphingosinicella sp.]|uniref:MarR family winged helix-turn-helix transcriptional regulator n=1 Tax=Allosphingosinicella sp. TaxID=2823234 RepID=UPI002FC0EB8A
MKDPRDLGDPGTAAFQLEKYPFYLLNRLVSRYNVVIEARLKTIGIDIPYWRVLMVLGQKSPRGVGQLAEAAVIPFSTMTRIVQRMVTAKLVVCRQLESDNRVTEVTMTSKGKQKLSEARMITAPVYAQIIRGFSIEDFEQLTHSLDRLHGNLAPLVPGKRNGDSLSEAESSASDKQ